MEIIAWVAFAIIVTANGPNVLNSDDAYASKEACEAANTQMLAQVKAHPQYGAILAIGTSCSEIKVSEIDHTKDPKVKGPKQSDLEQPVGPTTPSKFTSAVNT